MDDLNFLRITLHPCYTSIFLKNHATPTTLKYVFSKFWSYHYGRHLQLHRERRLIRLQGELLETTPAALGVRPGVPEVQPEVQPDCRGQFLEFWSSCSTRLCRSRPTRWWRQRLWSRPGRFRWRWKPLQGKKIEIKYVCIEIRIKK